MPKEADNLNQILSVIRHTPMAVMGLLLIGASAALVYTLHQKLMRTGEDTPDLLTKVPSDAIWTIPRAYLRAGSKQNWSRWPAYAVWSCMVSGIALLIAGLFQLAG